MCINSQHQVLQHNQVVLIAGVKSQLPAFAAGLFLLVTRPGINISFGKNDIEHFHPAAIIKQVVIDASLNGLRHAFIQRGKVALPAIVPDAMFDDDV